MEEKMEEWKPVGRKDGSNTLPIPQSSNLPVFAARVGFYERAMDNAAYFIGS
jgi:hypothetical protein